LTNESNEYIFIIEVEKYLYKIWETIMPRQDGTGPTWQGPMTGRGMGYCGRDGMGRNRQRRFLTKAEEKDVLIDEKKDLQAELKAIEERLTELEK
jgi:hypothetical protein